MKLRLTARLFSGRPDPSWTVTGEEARDLSARLRGLPAMPDGPAPPAPGLGYRGTEIAPLEGPVWTVFGGTVKRAGRVFADPGRTAERQALLTGRGEIEDALLDMLLHGLATGRR